MAEEIHLEDSGTIFIITILERGRAIDVSGMLVKKIRFQKPDQATFDNDMSFYTDGTDGKLQYTIVDGDLDQVGEWKVQVYLENNLGDWSSEIGSFEVYPNIEIT